MAAQQNAKVASKQARRDYPSVTVRIDRMIDWENAKVKAFASANIGGAFAVHGIRVMDSRNGLFVQMPQNSYQKEGKTVYEDIFHPITADARNELYGAVLAAYEQQLHMREDETQDMDEPDEGEEPVFEQKM